MRGRVWGDHDRIDAGDEGQLLPDLFGDERHEGVKQSQNLIERVDENGLGPKAGGLVLAVEGALGELEVPVTELVPEELVERRGCFGEFEPRQRIRGHPDRSIQTAKNPSAGERKAGIGGELAGRLEIAEVHQGEPRRVPKLVVESLVALDALERQLDVSTLLHHRSESESKRVP